MKTLFLTSDSLFKKTIIGLVYLFVLWGSVFCLVFLLNSVIFLYEYSTLGAESYSIMFEGGYFWVNGELVGLGPKFVNWTFWGLLFVGIVYIMKKGPRAKDEKQKTGFHLE